MKRNDRNTLKSVLTGAGAVQQVEAGGAKTDVRDLGKSGGLVSHLVSGVSYVESANFSF